MKEVFTRKSGVVGRPAGAVSGLTQPSSLCFPTVRVMLDSLGYQSPGSLREQLPLVRFE